MSENQVTYPVATMCRLLGVSSSGYYAWLTRGPSDRDLADEWLLAQDGFALVKELGDPRWAKYSSVPILILTSVREDAGRRRYELETGLELNVEDYVEKPIDPHSLLSRVETVLKKKKQQAPE